MWVRYTRMHARNRREVGCHIIVNTSSANVYVCWSTEFHSIWLYPKNLISVKIFDFPRLPAPARPPLAHWLFHFILFNYLVQSITFIYIFLSHISHMLCAHTVCIALPKNGPLGCTLLLAMSSLLSPHCISLGRHFYSELVRMSRSHSSSWRWWFGERCTNCVIGWLFLFRLRAIVDESEQTQIASKWLPHYLCNAYTRHLIDRRPMACSWTYFNFNKYVCVCVVWCVCWRQICLMADGRQSNRLPLSGMSLSKLMLLFCVFSVFGSMNAVEIETPPYFHHTIECVSVCAQHKWCIRIIYIYIYMYHMVQ